MGYMPLDDWTYHLPAPQHQAEMPQYREEFDERDLGDLLSEEETEC